MTLRDLRTALTLLLALAVPAPVAALQGPAAGAQASAPSLESRLAAIEKTIDEKRKELGIPGAALVVVKDDKVVYLKGLGYRNLEEKLPVTPDTLFAIGSATKAFVGLGVMMTADEGRLSLEDSPKKYLPYFRLRDPEADAKITVRNLLTHSSGLNRTDLAWITGALDRPEIIEVAALAKPTAKLGEKFQYQNVMYAAAGEIVGTLHKTSWERFTAERILAPLGMRHSNISVPETLASKDFSRAYEFNHATKETRRLEMRAFPEMSPAGAINSSARDMAQWLRFMLNGGAIDGKRLVSEKGFEELVKPQIKVGGTVSYGLGWFIREWRGHKVVEHGGNIDGFNAQVALMPDQKLGFVLLTNVTGSTLPQTAMEAVWSNFVGDPSATAVSPGPAGDPKVEVGSYLLKEANQTMAIELKDGKLYLTGAPGQPPYELVNVAGRRYKLAVVDGFFVTFRPAKDNPSETELYLEQPHGNFVLSKVTAPSASDVAVAAGGLRELVGRYENDKGNECEITVRDGKVALVVPGQPAYPIAEKGKDVYALGGLPDSFELLIRRHGDGKVSGLATRQPNGTFEFARVAEFVSPITVEELMAKVIDAQGGEANLRRHTSMVVSVDVDFEHQGMTAAGVVAAKAPNLSAQDLKFMALGREVGWVKEYFDGTGGAQETSFAPVQPLVGKALEAARIASDFYGLSNWKSHFKSVEIRKKAKVGEEECYVVVMTPERTNPITAYVSTKSFRILKRDLLQTSETTQMTLPATETYDDFRVVEGVVIPFKTVQSSLAMGDTIIKVREVKFDVPVPDAMFRPHGVAGKAAQPAPASNR